MELLFASNLTSLLKKIINSHLFNNNNNNERVLNAIVPGIIPKINENSKLPHVERENIALFLMGCRSLGLTEQMLFNVEDLYEGKNLRTVAVTLHWLAKVVQKNYPHITPFDPTGCSPLAVSNFEPKNKRPPETPQTVRFIFLYF